MRADNQLMDIRREIAALDCERAAMYARYAALAQRIVIAMAEKESASNQLCLATRMIRHRPNDVSEADLRLLRARYLSAQRTWYDLATVEQQIRDEMASLKTSQDVAVARHRRAYQRL